MMPLVQDIVSFIFYQYERLDLALRTGHVVLRYGRDLSKGNIDYGSIV